jgi:hypothetical protein
MTRAGVEAIILTAWLPFFFLSFFSLAAPNRCVFSIRHKAVKLVKIN